MSFNICKYDVVCGMAPFCSFDETHEPPNGHRESIGRMLGCAFALFQLASGTL